MASISVVLLGLNPETRLRPVVEYLHKRGVPGEGGGVTAWFDDLEDVQVDHTR